MTTGDTPPVQEVIVLRRPTLALVAAAALAAGALATPPATAAGSGGAPPGAISVDQVVFSGPALPDQPYLAVATGYWSSYGLTLDHEVIAAGLEYGGALDIPSSLDGKTVTAISAGYRHGLALDSEGDVTAWGWFDEDKTVPATVPTEVQDAEIVQIAAGGNHDLALTSTGTVLGWGSPDAGAIEVPDLSGVTVAAISTGVNSSAVLTTDGTVVSWGMAGGAPGSLDTQTVVAVEAGYSTVMALTDDGKLHAWGAEFTGVLNIPEAVSSGTVIAFDTSDARAMAATSDGEIHLWGNAAGDSAPLPSRDETVVDLQVDRYRSTASYATVACSSAPVVTGTAQVGQSLTVTDGSWTSTPDEVHFAWHADGQPVGTDSDTLPLVASMVGQEVSVTVSATAGGVTGDTTVTVPAAVAPGDFTTLHTVAIEGTRRSGSTLTAVVTDGDPVADSYRFQWYSGGNAVGTDSPTYRLRTSDVGNEVSVVVHPELTGYDQTTVQASAGSVTAGPATLKVGAPSTVRRGSTFTLTVKGLLPRERFTASLGGATVKSGRAGPAGTVSTTVTVSRTARLGPRPLVVVGSQPDRRGTLGVKVLAAG